MQKRSPVSQPTVGLLNFCGLWGSTQLKPCLMDLMATCQAEAKASGLNVVSLDWPAHREFHLSFRPLPGEKPAETVSRLATALRDKNAKIVRHEIFGSLAAHPETLNALQREFGNLDWPVTWVEGAASEGLSGMHIFAVAGTQVDTLRMDGRVVGRIFNDGCVRHCLLGDVRPSNLFASKSGQCRETLEKLERALHEAGMNMGNVVRTWFFLDDILSWYGPFNTTRDEFYRQRKMFKGLVPASTGIGGRNPARAAVLAGAWAIQTIKGSVAVQEVPSPLQCPSLEYGSAFSRAVLVDTPLCRRLLISGTASIGPKGQSMHVGNVSKQVTLTMEVARAILASRGFDFSDVTRATAYFRNIQDAPAFDTCAPRAKGGTISIGCD